MGLDCRNRQNNRDRSRRSCSTWLCLLFVFGLILIIVGLWGLIYFNYFDKSSDVIPTSSTDSPTGDDGDRSHPGQEKRSDNSKANLVSSIILTIGIAFVTATIIIGLRKRPHSSTGIPLAGLDRLESFDQKLSSTNLCIKSPSTQNVTETSSDDIKKFKPANEPLIPVKTPKVENSVPYPNRDDSDEEEEYAPPNDKDSLVLLPENYPNETSNPQILSAVRRLVLQEKLKLKTRYITEEDGYIKIEYLKNCTREYLQRTGPNSFIAKLRLQTGKSMRVMAYLYILKLIRLSFILTEPIENDDFLISFERDNGIRTSRCIVDSNETTSDGCEIIFAVTPMCYKRIIDKDTPLIIKQQAIECTVVDNPYPEFFNV